ncbi:YigZ family protein [Yimella sp. RIT 621]|uniref:IMPACT family protein n=1 Tax=unclassified Yimella TaxID=2649892 RepID=UPI00197AEEED|nr:YigZ family protein [Yimella sp. RIT 621]MCG8654426.1 IMPACT family protein [Yimella sp. NH-Cas1]
MSSYLTLSSRTDRVAAIEIKRSRFLAVVRRVGDEDAARALVADLRKQHHDARHHCSAFILGPTPSIERSNDDGEPAGTAGGPMLDVLRGRELSDVAAVVVRWFGGTLLGAGGLVRAYGDAVAAALDGAPLVRRAQDDLFDLSVSHADAGKVESDLRARGVGVLGVDYLDRALLHLAGDLDDLAPAVAEITSGAGILQPAGTRWVDRPT